MSGPLGDRVLELCAAAETYLEEGPALAGVRAVARGLDQPLRVAVAGRVSSGKSTLVNALLGRRVARTDAGECTRIVTWFEHGPERLQLRLKDGGVRELPLGDGGTMPERLQVDPIQVASAIVSLPTCPFLTQMTVADTPGLASANDADEATEELLTEGVRASQEAVGRADALVFLMTQTAMQDDTATLKAFQELAGGTRASSVNAVGVLSRADSFEGDDPLETARVVAERLVAEPSLRFLISELIPVAGLLAETSETDAFNEEDARDLRALAEVTERERMLLYADGFLNDDALPVPRSTRARLLGMLDLFGLQRALALIDEGTTGAAEIVGSLARASGFDRLRTVLLETFATRADVLKADQALNAVDDLTYIPDTNMSDAARERLRAEVERARLHPAMHRLRETWALQQRAQGRVHLPDALDRSLLHLMSDEPVRRRLGIDEDATQDEVRSAAMAGAKRWRELADGSSPDVQRIADVAVRSYTLLWKDNGSPGSVA